MSEALVRDEVSLDSLVAEVADDFLERQGRGERPDVEVYAARYPHAAEVLRNVLASLRLVGLSADGGHPPEADPGPAPAFPAAFPILRRVGRGGWAAVTGPDRFRLPRRGGWRACPFAPRWARG